MTLQISSFRQPVPEPALFLRDMPLQLGANIPIRIIEGESSLEPEVREINASEEEDIKEPEGDTLEKPELDTPPQ